VTKLWLQIPAKVREQITRAGRLFALTFAAQFLAAGEPVAWKAICAIIVAAAEVVVRQFVQVTPTTVTPALAPAPVPAPAPVEPTPPAA